MGPMKYLAANLGTRCLRLASKKLMELRKYLAAYLGLLKDAQRVSLMADWMVGLMAEMKDTQRA